MYEFVKTATGWRVFWGIDPVEPQSAPREFVPLREQTSNVVLLDRSEQPAPTTSTVA